MNVHAAEAAGPARAAALAVLTTAPPGRVKAAAEELLPLLGAVEVLVNRTGLVMLPYRDTAQGTHFFLGEVLMAEAHIGCPDHGVEGYAMVIGRDLEWAMAVAVLDAVGAAGRAPAQFNALIAEFRAEQAAADEALRRDIEATRVQMETF